MSGHLPPLRALKSLTPKFLPFARPSNLFNIQVPFAFVQTIWQVSWSTAELTNHQRQLWHTKTKSLKFIVARKQ